MNLYDMASTIECWGSFWRWSLNLTCLLWVKLLLFYVFYLKPGSATKNREHLDQMDLQLRTSLYRLNVGLPGRHEVLCILSKLSSLVPSRILNWYGSDSNKPSVPEWA